MAGNNNIGEEINKIADNEYNYRKTSGTGANSLSEEFSVAEETPTAGVKESGSLSGKTEKVATSSTGNVITQTNAATAAVKAVSGHTSVFYRIIMSLAAVFGAVVIGTSYIPAVRAEDARFIDINSYGREISIELEVLKWSADLKIRITGKDFTDYLEIENREEEYYQDYNQGDWHDEEWQKERNHRWLYYYVENAENGDTILLEIIGSTFMMSDVIDSKTVVLTLEEPEEPEEPEDRVSARFIDIETYERDIYIQLEVIKWSEDLEIRITGKDFVDYLGIEYYEEDDVGEWTQDNQNGTWLYYYVESAENGDEILLEILEGRKVIDTQTVVLEIEEDPTYDYSYDNQGDYIYPADDYNYNQEGRA